MRTKPTRMRRGWFGLALVSGAAWGSLCAAGDLRPDELREAVSGAVCLVTARDGFGLPLAHATGFLIGDGRFVLTDLAAVAQPGVVRATVRFEDGSTAEAAKFGFADAALGVAALDLGPDGAGRRGLALQADGPALDGSVAVTSAGWEWASALKLVTGRLQAGKSAADLASAAGCDSPPEAFGFFAVNGARVSGASGSPVLDAQGRVVAVWLELAIGTGAVDVAAPAPAIRRALLAAKPQLQPLTDLPRPLWPARVRPVAGESIAPARLAATVRSVKLRLRCDKCNGTGQVRVRRIIGIRKSGGMTYPAYGEFDEACPDCHGEGTVFRDTTHGDLVAMAEQAARVRFDPEVDPKAREATLAGVREVLDALANLKTEGRRAMLAAAAQAVRDDAEWPRGLVVWAQILDKVEAPDGGYVVLAPHGSNQRIAMRPEAERDAGAGQDPPAAPGTWQYGQWILVAGLGEGRVAVGGQRLVWIRPAVWILSPSLGRAPARPTAPGTGDGPATPQPQPRPKRPGFFGV
ncbi:MAG TPA: trypsin-like peptidase domain-containing protein [Phycisphaerae bacterium]|nr:trypsin-like peptidase domain-containing protein [Phycisphaerae bacterium]